MIEALAEAMQALARDQRLLRRWLVPAFAGLLVWIVLHRLLRELGRAR
jgi:hypothetical protein